MAKFWDWITGADVANAVSAISTPAPQSGWVEPTQNIYTLTYSEFFRGETDTLTREGALQVGGVKRGRALICGAVADAPLFAFRGTERLEVQPTWTYRTDAPGASPWHTWSLVLDDFIFYDESCLALNIGADGYPTDIARIQYDRWSVDAFGLIRIDGVEVDQKNVLRVPGPGAGGLLSTGAADVKAARALARARAQRAMSPVPLVEIHQTSDDQLDQEEIDQLVHDWAAARAANGGVGYTPHNVELRVHGDKTLDFFESAINASRTDIANHLNIPASLLDGSPNTASLTYETREGQSAAFWDQTVPYWLGPLEAALSSDRIVPRGQKVRFDFTQKRGPITTPAIAGAEVQD